jgi:hypothetical protein
VQTPTCAALAAAGKPDSLRVFNWWVARPGCSGDPSCFTQVVIDDNCQLFVQKTGQPVGGQPTPAQMFVLQPQDCQAARGWATSSQFLGALRSSSGCVGTARGEAFSVALNGVSPPFKSTDFCPEPSIDAVRTCVGTLVTRLTHSPWP